jgi:hypothetical protein
MHFWQVMSIQAFFLADKAMTHCIGVLGDSLKLKMPVFSQSASPSLLPNRPVNWQESSTQLVMVCSMVCLVLPH